MSFQGNPMSLSPKGKSRAEKLKFFGALAFVLASAGYLLLGNTFLRQEFVMDAAARHVPMVNSVLAGSSSFQKVRAGVTTAANGAILVLGEVSNAHDFEQLTNAIAQTKPPTKVIYAVKVLTENGDAKR